MPAIYQLCPYLLIAFLRCSNALEHHIAGDMRLVAMRRRRTHEGVASVLLPLQSLSLQGCNRAFGTIDNSTALEGVDRKYLQSVIVPELGCCHRRRDEHGVGGQRQARKQTQLARRHIESVYDSQRYECMRRLKVEVQPCGLETEEGDAETCSVVRRCRVIPSPSNERAGPALRKCRVNVS